MNKQFKDTTLGSGNLPWPFFYTDQHFIHGLINLLIKNESIVAALHVCTGLACVITGGKEKQAPSIEA